MKIINCFVLQRIFILLILLLIISGNSSNHLNCLDFIMDNAFKYNESYATNIIENQIDSFPSKIVNCIKAIGESTDFIKCTQDQAS